ncbi:MAG: hypothetical protein ACWA45_08890 [Flavobacteriales bacterium]
MKNQSFLKHFYALIPLIISGLVFLFVFSFLFQKVETNPDFINKLEENTTIFIALSGFLSIFIAIYLITSTILLKNNSVKVIENLRTVTEKMHNFRRIVKLLLQSNLWLPGLKKFIDEEYSNLNYFEVKEFYKGKSKLAIDFLQETHHFGETENLFLELKSLLITKPREKKIPKTLEFPKIYDNRIIEKWIEHKSGSGLMYFFGYKYGIYKDTLDYNKVYERHQEKIIQLAHTIDKEVFEDSTFNEVFLSKLGDYMSNQVLHQLYQIKNNGTNTLPNKQKNIYFFLLSLTLLGVLLPLCYLIFSLPSLILIFSYAFIISSIFFISIAIYPFLNKEINS